MQGTRAETKTLLIAGMAIALAGCSTTLSGTEQTVSVITPNLTGAACKLQDSRKGRWYLPSTPARVTVRKGDGPLIVVCEKEGYETASVRVEGRVAPNEVLGTLPLGVVTGLSGVAFSFLVDGATGAVARYPDEIIVPMKPGAVAQGGGSGAEGLAPAPRRSIQSLIEGLRRLSPMPVAVAAAPIRAEPSPSGQVVKLVHQREEVQIVDTLPSGWVQVAEEGKPIGWIHWTAFPIPRQTVRRAALPVSD